MRTFHKTQTVLVLTLMIAAFVVSCAPPYRRGENSYTRIRILNTARRYVGTPYRYGGHSPRGFDCSGYVMYVYKRNGIKVPRTAGRQYNYGRKISKRNLRPGDLVFFQTSRVRISHVGIYAGRNRFLHAPRPGKRVEFATLNNSYWNRRYRGAVTILN